MSRGETKTFAGRVALMRDRAGSVRALSRLVGFNPNSILNWMDGTMPYARTLRAVADRAGVSLDWLRDGAGQAEAELERMAARARGHAAGKRTAASEDPSRRLESAVHFILQHGSSDEVALLEEMISAAETRVRSKSKSRRGAKSARS